MSPESNLKCSLIFYLFFVAFSLSLITALPVTSMDDPLDKFIQFLSHNNCSMPKEVELPFSQTDPSPFGYLSIPLEECKSSNAFKANNKANLLCKETFDVLQNITCTEYNVLLPKINSSHLSNDVCKDFAAIQNIIPTTQEEYLSRKFSDNIICKVLCTEKYELLCKTLLWSYDTQAKIKNALQALTEKNGQENVNNDPLNNGASNAAQPGTDQESHPDMNEITDDKTVSDLKESAKKPLDRSNLNNLIPVPSTTKNVSNQPIKNNSALVALDVKNTKLNNSSQEAKTMGSDRDITQSKDNKALPKSEQNQDNLLTEQNLNDQDKNTDHKENTIGNLSKDMKNENAPDATHSENVKASTQENENNQSKKSNASPGEENNDNTNNNLNIKMDDKTDVPINPKSEENDLGNADYQVQENETETQKRPVEFDNKIETLKGDLTPDLTISKQESGLLDSTILPDKSEEIEQRPEVKDPEQYNNGFSTLKKNSDVKHSNYEGSSRISASSNIQISPDDFTGRQPEISRNYLPGRNYLPEQEDSHFFFYFLSIVLILMAGYLIFHNKQKIIALIVEGRHERRRRSHGAGYKKLETK